MPRAARLFKYGQCALKERPRLRIVALVPKQVREVVEGRGRVGMLRPQRVFAYGKVGRHFGVPDCVLNVLVAEVMLQGPRVVAIIGELEPTGMAKRTAERMPSACRS